MLPKTYKKLLIFFIVLGVFFIGKNVLAVPKQIYLNTNVTNKETLNMYLGSGHTSTISYVQFTGQAYTTACYPTLNLQECNVAYPGFHSGCTDAFTVWANYGTVADRFTIGTTSIMEIIMGDNYTYVGSLPFTFNPAKYYYFQLRCTSTNYGTTVNSNMQGNTSYLYQSPNYPTDSTASTSAICSTSCSTLVNSYFNFLTASEYSDIVNYIVKENPLDGDYSIETPVEFSGYYQTDTYTKLEIDVKKIPDNGEISESTDLFSVSLDTTTDGDVHDFSYEYPVPYGGNYVWYTYYLNASGTRIFSDRDAPFFFTVEQQDGDDTPFILPAYDSKYGSATTSAINWCEEKFDQADWGDRLLEGICKMFVPDRIYITKLKTTFTVDALLFAVLLYSSFTFLIITPS